MLKEDYCLDSIEYYVGKRDVLTREINELEKELSSMPEGVLASYKVNSPGGGHTLWYKKTTDNGKVKREYIQKSDFALAKTLAEKNYKSLLLSDKKNELKSIDAYLKHRKPDKSHRMFDPKSAYSEFFNVYEDWEYMPYEKSTDHPEHLNVPAPKDEFVRSKSEATIAQILFQNHIPYRYEYIHYLCGVAIATDFTILHPKTYEEYVWEHFGRLDDPGYVARNIMKLPKYFKEGYIPGRNFIMTFETVEYPLGYMEVEDIVRRYFL